MGKSQNKLFTLQQKPEKRPSPKNSKTVNPANRIRRGPAEGIGSEDGVSSLKGFYLIGALATAIGIGVVIILNMATPLEYILDQLAATDQGRFPQLWHLFMRRFLGLWLLLIVGYAPLLLLMREVLKPVSRCLKLINAGQKPPGDVLQKARQRLINLPFIMIPANIGLWILLPAALFYAAYATGRLESVAALSLAVRSTMVGFISAVSLFFWIESYARRRAIPLFFPDGRLTEVGGTARMSISRRIRAFYRLSSLVPMAILVLTLVTLQWQLNSAAISAKEYGHGVLVFSLVLFAVSFIGSGRLNRLVTNSIVEPVNSILATVTRIQEGDYETRVEVVSNDETGVLGDATNEMIRGLRERELLRDTFGKYVGREIRDEILGGRISLDGELMEVTVLFADLRDFTPMTESNDPKLVIRILNRYFEEMAEAIHNHGGLVLQFIGDEIYAVFGAPISRPDHPVRAFRAGVEMSRRLAKLNKAFTKKGWPTLRHGIGIHTGEALAANIGSPDRLSYLLVGDTVNLASRLQWLTKEIGAEMVVSATTRVRLPESELTQIKLRRLPPTPLKGKSVTVEIFTLA